MVKRIFLILAILLAGITANATDYYVAKTGNDSNDGSAGSPWLTVYKATSTVTAGAHTIHIAAGTYSEGTNQLVLAVGVSIVGVGDASHIITTYHPVGADSFDGALKLSSPAQTNGNQSVSYIKLTGSSLTAWYGIMTANRNNVKIHHCTIEDFRDRGVKFWGHADSDGVYTTGSEIYNCTIKNSAARVSGGNSLLHFEGQEGMLIHDNILSNLDHAADAEYGNAIGTGDGYNRDIKIYNNKIYTLPDMGVGWNMAIEHWDSRGGIEIYNNEFYGGGTLDMGGYTNSKGAYSYSFWVHDNYFDRGSTLPFNASREYPAMSIEGTCRDIIIERNHVKYFQFGIKQSLATNAITHERIYIRYNIFENCGVTNNNWGAAHMQHHGSTNTVIDSVFFYNNVFTQSASAASGAFGALWQPSNQAGQSTTNLIYKNNIIKGFTEAPFGLYPDGVGGTITSMTNAFNILYQNGNSNDIWYDGTASITNLTESDNLKVDPLFISTTNFRLQASSPAINAGTDVSLTSDYDGNPIVGIVDIGAFEYQTLPVATTGLGWEDVLSKRDFKDDVNLPQSRWMIAGIPVTATASELNALVGQGQIISGIDTASLSRRIDLKADTVDQSFTGTTVISKLNLGSATSNTKAEVDSSAFVGTQIADYVAGDTTSRYIAYKDRIQIDSIPNLGGFSAERMEFIVDTTANAPNKTDSIFSQAAFINKHLEIYRGTAGGNLYKQYRKPVGQLYHNGYSFQSLTGRIVFTPQFATGEHVIIEVTDSTAWTNLAIGAAAYEEKYQTVLDAMATDPSAANKTIQNDMVHSLDSAGYWARADILLIPATEINSSGEALVNWIKPGTCDASDPTTTAWTQYFGYQGNSTIDRIELNYNPYTDSTTVTATGGYGKNSGSIGVYITTNIDEDRPVICAYNSLDATKRISLTPRASNVAEYYINANTDGTIGSVTNSSGWWMATRTAPAAIALYHGSGAAIDTDTDVSTALPNAELMLFKFGNLDFWSSQQVAIVIVMNGVTQADKEGLRVIFERYLRRIGTI